MKDTKGKHSSTA